MRRRSTKAKPELALSAEEQSRAHAVRYTLTYDEAYEAFYLLADKWGKKWRLIAFIALGAAAAVSLGLAVADRTAIQYSMLTVFSATLMLLVWSWPAAKARRGAKTVTREAGTYRLTISHTSGIRLPNGQTVPLQGDPDARAFETAQSFVIRPDRRNSFCVPKRVLKDGQVSAIRRILYSGIRNARLMMPPPPDRAANDPRSATTSEPNPINHPAPRPSAAPERARAVSPQKGNP
jgi:hypothetical protein